MWRVILRLFVAVVMIHTMFRSLQGFSDLIGLINLSLIELVANGPYFSVITVYLVGFVGLAILVALELRDAAYDWAKWEEKRKK